MSDRIERRLELPASIEQAWTAVTDPRWLERWLADEVELDLQPAGPARFRLGETERSGWVEEVSPPDGQAARLVFWWSQDGEPASRVELILCPTDTGTEIRVIEARPLEILDLVGIPVRESGGNYGPSLVAA